MKATKKMRTHKVGRIEGISKIVQSNAAMGEKPTMQNPLDMRLPAKATRRNHLKSSYLRKKEHLPIWIKMILSIGRLLSAIYF